MSLASDAAAIRDATITNFNTAARVGAVLYAVSSAVGACVTGLVPTLSDSDTGAANAALIQAAITDAPTAGVVQIPPGLGTVYVTTIALSGGKKLFCLGGTTIMWVANSASAMLTFAGDGCALSGLTFDGNGSNQSGNVVAMVPTVAPRLRFENCRFENFKYKMFLTDATASPGGEVSGCYVYNCAQVNDSDIFGIRSSRWSFIGNSFEHVTSAGHMIRLGQYDVAVGVAVTDCRIIGNSFYDTAECAVVCETLTQGAVIDGNTFRNCADGGVKCESAAIELVKNITISNNTFHTITSATNAPFQWGVAGTYVNNRCYDCNGGFDLLVGSVVEGNYLENCGAVGFPSITVNSTATGSFLIRGNRIVDVPTGVAGIDVAADDCIVEGNWVERAAAGAMTDGIVARGGSTRVAGNTIKNVGGRGIRAFGGLNSIEGNSLIGSTTAITLDATFTTSSVVGNNISTFSVAAYSFTNNAAFRGVILKDNPGGVVPQFSETIASGVIYVGKSHVAIALETEGGTATDDLDKIDAVDAYVGQIVILNDNNSTHDVTVKHATNNISLTGAADYVIDNSSKRIALQWSGTRWCEMWRALA
jgi:hypothetical protein